MMYSLIASSLLFSSAAAAAFKDCNDVDLNGLGPYGAQTWFNATAAEDGSAIFVFHPDLSKSDKFPVMVFSHGATGEYAMYTHAIERYVSHGFVVVHPHVKSPSKDTSPLTLDPYGDFTLKGFNYATVANTVSDNPLHNKLDLSNVILVGHSMGATSTIMAAKRLEAGKVKACLSQHPGICGPYGPPPCLGPGRLLCNTWMPSDFEDVASKMPILLTTATNDAAFWPQPHTAEHEFGCFNKSTRTGSSSKGTIFTQFSADACKDDGKGGRFDRKWSNGGHDCPMLENSPETLWILTAAKLYAQMDGNTSSNCHARLWGADVPSAMHKAGVEKLTINPPSAASPEKVIV